MTCKLTLTYVVQPFSGQWRGGGRGGFGLLLVVFYHDPAKSLSSKVYDMGENIFVWQVCMNFQEVDSFIPSNDRLYRVVASLLDVAFVHHTDKVLQAVPQPLAVLYQAFRTYQA